MKERCGSCSPVTVNGVYCHENGCPESWYNYGASKAYPVECRWCGIDYTPMDRDEAERRFCSDDCAKSYYD